MRIILFSRTLKYPIEESPSLHHNKEKKEKAHNHPEESAVKPPPYKHQSTKVIPIEESVALIQEQKKRNEVSQHGRNLSGIRKRLGWWIV